MKTTREKIEVLIRESDGITPSEISKKLDIKKLSSVISHIKHISKSLDEEEIMFVWPPECQSCGFDRFNKKLNLPSRCPKCKSERLSEPKFLID